LENQVQGHAPRPRVVRSSYQPAGTLVLEVDPKVGTFLVPIFGPLASHHYRKPKPGVQIWAPFWCPLLVPFFDFFLFSLLKNYESRNRCDYGSLGLDIGWTYYLLV
jgi:hypothetical protein